MLGARKLLDLELERAKRRGLAVPERLRVGVMFEVPALAWQLDSLLPHVDFISVGTNDLLQFLYAADRGQHPSGRPLRQLVPTRCFDCYILWLRRCGRRGSIYRSAARWRDVRSRRWHCWQSACARLSMSPGAIGPVKAMVRSLDLNEATVFSSSVLTQPDRPLRETLRLFAADHAVEINS